MSSWIMLVRNEKCEFSDYICRLEYIWSLGKSDGLAGLRGSRWFPRVPALLVFYEPRFCSLGITFLSGNWFNEREEVNVFSSSLLVVQLVSKRGSEPQSQCRVHTRLGPLLRLFLTTWCVLHYPAIFGRRWRTRRTYGKIHVGSRLRLGSTVNRAFAFYSTRPPAFIYRLFPFFHVNENLLVPPGIRFPLLQFLLVLFFYPVDKVLLLLPRKTHEELSLTKLISNNFVRG